MYLNTKILPMSVTLANQGVGGLCSNFANKNCNFGKFCVIFFEFGTIFDEKEERERERESRG